MSYIWAYGEVNLYSIQVKWEISCKAFFSPCIKANKAKNGGCNPLLTPQREDPKAAWATGTLEEVVNLCVCYNMHY